MNNMPYLMIPDMNMMNYPFPYNPNPSSSKIIELEDQINRLSREVRRLEHRVNKLEKKNQLYISKPSTNEDDDSSIYMV